MPCPECGALKPEELGYDADNVARLKCKKCGTCYRSDYTKKGEK
ncbi:unnamed protein product [marine sediment metagenome]|uniref:Uncharacterized protein n=1 Tax=marine sediment metagenome TaxID=412755 RepID=X1PS76_9ZZZZ